MYEHDEIDEAAIRMECLKLATERTSGHSLRSLDSVIEDAEKLAKYVVTGQVPETEPAQ